jgi:phosphoribosylamine--glycine ligase
VLVGNGGREHALAWRIAKSPSLGRLLVTAPHPAWPEGAELVEAGAVEDVARVAQRARADLVVVGPEAPLAAGMGDRLAEVGIPCFGPSRAAARLETSKAFTKEILTEVHVPTAEALVVERGDAAGQERALARCRKGDVVLKADGLAAGKGVVVCRTPAEALVAFEEMGRFGSAADRLVLEDRLEGPEVSLFALCDGERVVALLSAQDHKRLGDGDTGPNTGGMGAIAPTPLVDAVRARDLVDRIHLPVIERMAARGTPFRGVLYAGLILTQDGPRVLEFNVRFGDPECQPLMALWEDDVLPWLHGAAIGRLPAGRPAFATGAACCVVLAARGYPEAPEKGALVPEPDAPEGVVVFYAGAARAADGSIHTTGGRVLAVTAVADDLRSARERAYDFLPQVAFPGAVFRTDIGASALR